MITTHLPTMAKEQKYTIRVSAEVHEAVEELMQKSQQTIQSILTEGLIAVLEAKEYWPRPEKKPKTKKQTKINLK